MVVRIADEKDIERIYALRFEVFVNEQNVPPEIELDEEDAHAAHIIAEEKGKTIGCARLLTSDNEAHIGRLAVNRSARNSGIGSEICRFIINHCCNKGLSYIWLNSQLHAVGFYEKLGFVREGEVFMEAGIEHVKMVFDNSTKEIKKMDLTEKQVTSQLIFDGKVVHLYKDTVKLPDGNTSVREYVKHLGAVCVVPITDSGEVILERQYRYAVGQVLTEIPAGKLDYAGEDWESAARRELLEETGAVAEEMIDLGDYYGSPAIMGERIRMFMARGLTFREQNLDKDEFLEVFKLPLSEAVEMVLRGEISDGKTQVAILRAAMMK